jgi:hypothetical protein
LAGIIDECLVGPNSATPAYRQLKISCYMICQSYWKMFCWHKEHKCGRCMMVL